MSLVTLATFPPQGTQSLALFLAECSTAYPVASLALNDDAPQAYRDRKLVIAPVEEKLSPTRDRALEPSDF